MAGPLQPAIGHRAELASKCVCRRPSSTRLSLKPVAASAPLNCSASESSRRATPFRTVPTFHQARLGVFSKLTGNPPVPAPITRPPLIAAGFSAFLFFAITQLSISAPQPEPDQHLCTVKGIVADAATNERLRKAFVRLMGTAGSYPA